MRRLMPNEKKLVGQWIVINKKVEGDKVCQRIKYLIANCLEKVGLSEDGCVVGIPVSPSKVGRLVVVFVGNRVGDFVGSVGCVGD